MKVHVAELEINRGIRALDLPAGAGGALLLVRRNGRPAGLVRLDGPGPFSPESVQTEIERQVAPNGTAGLPAVPSGRFSIVVCTHEQAGQLRACLEALRPAAAVGHEVLVVDSAPRTSRTAALVAQYPYRYLCEPFRGLNNARNCGLLAARHPFVAFIEGDTIPDPFWIAAVGEGFNGPEVGCVTGLVLPVELETGRQLAFDLCSLYRRRFEQKRFAAPQLPPAAAGVVGVGGNMAFRRQLLLHLGGFDPRLDRGTATRSGGDTDMFARVLDAGARILYTPHALVWQPCRQEESFGYGVGLYSFLTKRLVEQGDLQALTVASGWLANLLCVAASRRLRGLPSMPLSLLLREAVGALAGPLRFWQENHRFRSHYLDRCTLR